MVQIEVVHSGEDLRLVVPVKLYGYPGKRKLLGSGNSPLKIDEEQAPVTEE